MLFFHNITNDIGLWYRFLTQLKCVGQVLKVQKVR